jgi:hypothetical protein
MGQPRLRSQILRVAPLLGLWMCACAPLRCEPHPNPTRAPNTETHSSETGGNAPSPIRAKLAAVQGALSAGKVFVPSDSDEPALLVPKHARANLREFKDLVLGMVGGAISSATRAKVPTEHLRRALSAQGVTLAEGESWQEGAVELRMSKVPAHPNLWAVLGTILLAPGSDEFLVLYDVGSSGRAREVHVLRSDDYKTVQGAIHALHFKVGQPSEDGEFLLVEAHTHPWMASRSREFSYRAYSIGEAMRKVVDEHEPESNWENGYRLTVDGSDFKVEFDVWEDAGPSFQRTETRRWYGEGTEFVSAKSDSPKSYASFYEVLRRAVSAADRHYVARQIRFPVYVAEGNSGVRREVKSADEFIREYDKLLTIDWRRSFATGEVEETPTFVYAGTDLQVVMGQVCEGTQTGFCPAGPIKIVEFRKR